MNFTDPEAKIMKQSNKGFDYSYNAQAVVDGADQIIVSAEVTREANDKKQALPMARAAIENLKAAGIERPKGADGTPVPIPNTADTGYFSEAAVGGLEQIGMEPYLAVERQKHHEAAVAPEATSPAAGASAKEKMKEKLRTTTGKALYARGSRSSSRSSARSRRRAGIRQFLLRGLEKVSAEWQLICLTHNLLKIWRRRCELRGKVRAEGGPRPKRPRPSGNPGDEPKHERILGHAPSGGVDLRSPAAWRESDSIRR